MASRQFLLLQRKTVFHPSSSTFCSSSWCLSLLPRSARQSSSFSTTSSSSSSSSSITINTGNTTPTGNTHTHAIPTTATKANAATTTNMNTQGQQSHKNKLLRSLSSLPDHGHDPDHDHDHDHDENDHGDYEGHARRVQVPRKSYIQTDAVQLNSEGYQYEHVNVPKEEESQSVNEKVRVKVTPEPEPEPTTDTSDNMNHHSPSHISYLADVTFPITSELKIIRPNDDAPSGIWPVYRIMDENGTFRNNINDGYQQPSNRGNEHCDGCDYNDNGTSINALKQKLIKDHPQHAQSIQSSLLFHSTASASAQYYKSFVAEPCSPIHGRTNDNSKKQNNNNVNDDNDDDDKSSLILLRAHRMMTRLRQMDDVLLNAQRQGRISFYLTCRGEEGIHVGSASALSMDDVVLAQYREQGILMWRGFTLDQFTNQCFTNDLDLGRGRQMPIHYGSRALNYHTISSPLGTQLPQAVGVAYKMKLDKLGIIKSNNDASNNIPTPSIDKNGSISIVYFGDGAASTTDFHSALNFAATLEVPMIFFCRNNGYAISTKTTEQYASDGIVCRSRGYGIAAIRVDGNDIFAVHSATKAAREYAIQHSKPVLIEAISYRQGHHSTSDDSYQYRSIDEVNNSENIHDPLRRFEMFLMKQDCMDKTDISTVSNGERMSVLKAMERSEKRPQPKLETMFQDVYKDMPLNLMVQEKTLQKHMKKYPERY